MSETVIAIDLGGTNLRAARIDRSGMVQTRTKTPTPRDADNPLQIVEAIVRSIKDCAEGTTSLPPIAIVVPGSVDAAAEKIVKAPHLPCLNNFPLKKNLADRLSTKVILENDANAAAVGEMWKGAAQEFQSIICLTLGTGIGGGIILNGDLWRGVDGSSGEIGHTTVEPASDLKCDCGNRGCLELFTSATGITRMARAAGSSNDVTAKQVYDAAIRGDAAALKIFETVGSYLGISIANLLNILNPQAIVIGGGVANAWSLFQPKLMDEVTRRAFPLPAQNVRIIPARCGDDAGLLGAAKLALFENL